MQNKKENYRKIRRESSDIAKYAGLFASRIVLLVSLCVVMYPTRPTSVYLIAITALLPWVLANILAGKHAEPADISLRFCAQRYRYSAFKLTAEKYTGYGMMILLIVWQFALQNSKNVHGFWKISPACCLAIYCACRLAGTLFYRHRIHQEYFDLKILDD